MKFIDLFAGIGGIRLGFEEFFGECVFSSEIDKFAKDTYEANFNERPSGDITQIDEKDIPAFNILLGGFPCQPFSYAGLKKGFEDTRGTMFFHIARIISYHKPQVIFLENVKALKNHDKGKTFSTIKSTLENFGYTVYSEILNAKNFGLPQNRERIYIVAFLDNVKFSFPKGTNASIKVGDILDRNVPDKYTISDKLWEGHQRRKVEHKLKGNGFGYSLFNQQSPYTSTISARYYKDGSEILIEQKDKNPRKLTPKEAGKLQGFPKNFIIPVSDNQAYKQFGNSVAVPVIKSIAKEIKKALEINKKENNEVKIEKLKLSKEKVDINLQFYCFLKQLVKLKLTNPNVLKIIEEHNLLENNIAFFIESISNIVKGKKKEELKEILINLKSPIDTKLFIFALKLYNIRDMILQEAKITEGSYIQNLKYLDPLSLEYDKISVIKPYTTRVSSALLTLLFFENIENHKINFMSENSINFLKDLSKEFLILKNLGLESNQIFMLIMTETVNQSIISDSGSNYESRIRSVLDKNGIKDIKKEHDKNDKSTEFDFFFELNGKTYGIGAKRTLRERYKQFIKTSLTSKIDVMIEITLGTDLNEEKAKTIVNHGTYIFVSNEIYQEKEYLQKMSKVYSVKDLTLDTLKALK